MFKSLDLSTLLVIISFITLNSKEPSMITLPLKVIKNGFEKYPIKNETYITYETEVEVQTIFGKKTRKLLQETHGIIKKLDCLLFAAPITIGSEQNFNVILDTGSVDLWVPKNGSIDDHEIDNHYYPSKSKTAHETSDKFSIQYGTGSTEGVFYTDYISFITDHTDKIKFGVASKTCFDVDGADGIMGLARSYSNKEQNSKIWTMNKNGKISSKSFSFKFISETEVDMYLGDEHPDFSADNSVNNTNNTNHTAQCKLLKGGTYEDLLWTCRLYQFGLISTDRTKNATANCGFSFLFDTGSNIMWLPINTLESLSNELSQFNCQKSTIEGESRIICNDVNILPDIFIEVGDHYLIMDKEKMFYEYYEENNVNASPKYVLNIAFQKDIQISLIGQPFFTLFHTRFDYENKVLKFYSEEPDKIIFSSTKPDEKEPIDWQKVGIAVAAALAFFIVICCLYRTCRRMCGSKKKV